MTTIIVFKTKVVGKDFFVIKKASVAVLRARSTGERICARVPNSLAVLDLVRTVVGSSR
jgi:hypothetical protein